MKLSLKTGFSFGLTSGVITTLGLMVGLHSGTHSKAAVAGGILTIAIADAFSDALGIHMTQEVQVDSGKKEIWNATFSTLFSKLVFALTFLAPVLMFELLPAMVISVAWGLLVLSVFSYFLAKRRGTDPLKIILEHLVIALLVIVITHFIGDWIAQKFA